MLVALADHGFTPTAIAARLTYLSAPESVQGALAAGLLGGGSRFLGVTEDCGRFLAEALAAAGERLPDDDAGWDAVALEAVQRAAPRAGSSPAWATRSQGHRSADPRADPDRRGGGTARPAPAACSRRSAGSTPRSSGVPCRSTARAPAARPSPTLASRFTCSAASPSSPGRPRSSATWPKSSATPIGMDVYITVDRNADTPLGGGRGRVTPAGRCAGPGIPRPRAPT